MQGKSTNQFTEMTSINGNLSPIIRFSDIRFFRDSIVLFKEYLICAKIFPKVLGHT